MMASVGVIAMALVLASTTAYTSHPSESARDQYEAGEDGPRPPQLFNEATDHPLEVHRFDSIAKPPVDAVDSLQMGCGDGLIQENGKSKAALKKPRRKRSYTPWVSQRFNAMPYHSFTVWKPPVYQLSRPYYIPIFGVPGRIPIYYPPQPILLNPGQPQDNPLQKPFAGPSYLPPAVTQKPAEEGTTMTLANRFNGGDNGDGDKPVWDVVGGATQAPPRDTVVPTRRPMRPGRTSTHPPLVHSQANEVTTSRPQANEVTTSRPQSSDNELDAPVVRPQGNAPPQQATSPSRCVWAIISCCSTTGEISYDCFEQRGCPGAFWDRSPCDSDFARAAIASAVNYYNSK